MSGIQLYAENIAANLIIPSQTQGFSFSTAISQYQIFNLFIPTSLVYSQNLLEFINVNDAGYRFRQITSNLATTGNLILEAFTMGAIPGTALVTFTESGPIILSPTSSNAIQLKNNSNAIPLQFYNSTGSNYVALKAGTLSTNTTWTLPTTDSTGTQALVSNGSGTLSWQSMSGGTVTSVSGTANRITSTGGTTPVIDISSLYVGQSSIVTVGTVTTGTWNGNTIGIAYGGTGNTTFTPYSLICGGTTSTGAFQNIVGVGTSGQVLTSSGSAALPTWQTPSGGTITSVSGTANRITSTGGTTPVIDISSLYVGQSSIVTVGTVTTGTWNSAIGPNISVPFIQLNYNWTSAGGSPYIFNHTINDSAPFFKEHIYQIISRAPDVARSWQVSYNLGDPNAWSPTYSLSFFHPIFSPSGTTPFSLVNIGGGVSPLWGLYLTARIDMGGYEIQNALNPTTAQSLTTKNYVDTAISANITTLTGAITGSGTGSIATTLAASQTVTGTTQTFNYSNALSSSIFSLVNTNASAITRFRAGTATDYIELGYDGSNGYSFINLASSSNDRLAFRVNGTGIAALLSSGLFGLGTITPTQAKLVISGGVQNIAGEESALRVISALNNVKIELQSTAAGGKLYELRSSSTGAFDVTDRTVGATRFTIDTNGNIGIGGSLTPHAPLQLGNVTGNRKIVLFESANNDHQFSGFGLNTTELRYQVGSTAANHIFYAGTSTTTSNELGRITGTGDFISPGNIYGRRPTGICYMQSNVTGVAATANVWIKAAGSTASSTLNQFTMPVNNRLQYTGTNTIMADIRGSVTISDNTNSSINLGISIFKNGVQVVPSIIFSENTVNGFFTSITTNTFVSMATNDYIEVYVQSSANTTITLSYMILTITTT